MKLSYWEIKEWFTNVDFTIVGSGIVGLSCALELRKKYPKAKIVLLEKGRLPQGASTKNAGFACFGSLSELAEDLKNHSPEEIFDLVKKRWEGLQLLRKKLGDTAIDFKQTNGFELFKDAASYHEYISYKETINKLLEPLFKREVFSISKNIFNFNNIHKNYVVNNYEGQIDPGKMMVRLLYLAQKAEIKIVNNVLVESFEEHTNKVYIKTSIIDLYTRKLCLATNGFSKQLVHEEVEPARAQVLITKPIEGLKVKGVFHLDRGYYYFRNIDNRILLGGGRNLDFKTEKTMVFGKTTKIQKRLEAILKEVIVPDTDVETEYRWSGIMGVGRQKKAIIRQISNHIFCGIRLGGMGIAIGSLVGKKLADMLD